LDLGFGIVTGFGLGGRDISDWFEQTTGIEPVDPFEGSELDGYDRPPRAASMDHLGFEQAVDRLGQRVVLAVADAADGRLDARLRQPLGVADRQVLRDPVAMMHEPTTLVGTTLVQGLLQGIQHEGSVSRP